MAEVKRRILSAAKASPKAKSKNPIRVKDKTIQLASSLQLPTTKTVIETDLASYNILAYGQPKIGKTTIFASFPDPLFFFFEIGGKALSVFKFPSDQPCVETWEEVIRGVDLLETTDRFENVVFDDTAAAYSLCMDYVCRQLKIKRIEQDTSGKRDRSGLGWQALKMEFRHQIDRIQRTRRAVHFTAHSKDQKIETRSTEFTRIVPRFTGQCESIIVPLVDHIFFVDYYRLTAGGIGRVLLTKGDDLVQAGHKSGAFKPMPRYILLPEDEPQRDYEIIAAAFRGEEKGLDVSELQASAVTSEAGVTALAAEKIKDAQERVAAAKGGASA